MPSKRPNIAGFNERLLLEGDIGVKVIIVRLALLGVREQVVDLGGVKTCKGDVEIRALNIRDHQRQLVLIPIAADFVQRYVERLFPGFVHLDDYAVHLVVAKIHQDFRPLMAANDMLRGLVPDEKIHIAELLDRAFQLFILRVSGIEILSGVILRRFQIGKPQFFNRHFPAPPELSVAIPVCLP